MWMALLATRTHQNQIHFDGTCSHQCCAIVGSECVCVSFCSRYLPIFMKWIMRMIGGNHMCQPEKLFRREEGRNKWHLAFASNRTGLFQLAGLFSLLTANKTSAHLLVHCWKAHPSRKMLSAGLERDDACGSKGCRRQPCLLPCFLCALLQATTDRQHFYLSPPGLLSCTVDFSKGVFKPTNFICSKWASLSVC